jgi:hypothetical protein
MSSVRVGNSASLNFRIENSVKRLDTDLKRDANPTRLDMAVVSSSRKFCLFEFSYRELALKFSIRLFLEAGKNLLELTAQKDIARQNRLES